MDNIDALKTKQVDEPFHRSRIMFVIKDGKIEVASPYITISHIEWFEKEGWITKDNEESLLENSIRGFYLPSQNQIYFYRGFGFSFDDTVVQVVKNLLTELQTALNLNDNTEIHLGPKDEVINGIKYNRSFVSTVKQLQK